VRGGCVVGGVRHGEGVCVVRSSRLVNTTLCIARGGVAVFHLEVAIALPFVVHTSHFQICAVLVRVRGIAV